MPEAYGGFAPEARKLVAAGFMVRLLATGMHVIF